MVNNTTCECCGQLSVEHCKLPGVAELTTNERVYVIVTTLTAVLSIFGSVLIICVHVLVRSLRTSTRAMLVHLSVADMLNAFGILFGVFWYVFKNSAVINSNMVYCKFHSALTIFSSIASFLWTVVLALCLYMGIVRNFCEAPKRFRLFFLLLCWGLPGSGPRVGSLLLKLVEAASGFELPEDRLNIVIISGVIGSLSSAMTEPMSLHTPSPTSYIVTVVTIIALAVNVLGYDQNLKQASWCWIDPSFSHTLFWQMFTGKAWELVACAATLILYMLIKAHILRQKRQADQVFKARPSNKHRIIEEANRKLTFVPIIFIVLRFWGTLRFLLGEFAHDYAILPEAFWIAPLQGIGDSAQGFANAIFYCIFTDRVRNKLKNVICPCVVRLSINRVHHYSNNGEESSVVDVPMQQSSSRIVL